MRALVEAPAPPKALRRAVLERLGLEPARPAAGRWASAPRWGAALAGLLVLAWLLPLPKPWGRRAGPAPSSVDNASPRPAARLSGTLALAVPASHAARRHGSGPQGRGHGRRNVQEVEVALVPARPGAGAHPPLQAENQSIGVRSSGPQAVGEASAESPTTGSKGIEVGLGPGTPSPPLTLDSVRGNLLRPGQGQGLGFTVTLGQAGPLRAVVLDERDRLAATLYDGEAGPGSLDLSWDGGSVPSGTYTVLIQAGGTAQTFHVLVVR